jgi:hypothetical protein
MEDGYFDRTLLQLLPTFLDNARPPPGDGGGHAGRVMVAASHRCHLGANPGLILPPPSEGNWGHDPMAPLAKATVVAMPVCEAVQLAGTAPAQHRWTMGGKVRMTLWVVGW